MYLYDTNVISEFRKRQKNPNVIKFHAEITRKDQPILLSVITYGEILKGINILKRNRDFAQADRVEQWFDSALKPIEHLALAFDLRCAKIW